MIKISSLRMTLCSMLQREWETLKNESSRVLQRVSPRYLQHKCSKYRRLLSLALPLLRNVVNHIYYLSFSICPGSFYALLSEFIFASAFFFPFPIFPPEMLSYPAFGQALTVYRFSIQPLSPPFLFNCIILSYS